MSHLVSYHSQIEPNLRRTASKGLISLLNHYQLEDLAFKYFGIKDEYGNITGYQCPYSGKIYTDYKDIVLEHIVPVVSNGGTVLFNCIPTSKEVNGADQKGAKHLITWWLKSKYWDKDAPLRLEKIVNYMLDAYDQVFTEYTIEEVESSYLEIDTDESNLNEEDNLEYSETNENKLLRQAKNNGIHSYLGFILDCINTLENKEICNIDTTEIRRKLTELKDKHIFEDIERYQLFQNIIQKLIVSRIGDDNRSYLTYSLNFDIKKLMDSIKSNNPEEIYKELNTRLHNIEQLLQQNNLSTVEYFKSLKDIKDIDIIYKNINYISKEDIKAFLENIKIGIDTKIDIFINMLNQGKSEVLRNRNKEILDGYPSIKLDYFWGYHQEKIKTILFENLKDNFVYEPARQTVLTYFGVSSYEELMSKQNSRREQQKISIDTKVDIFIKMLNQGKNEILKQKNKKSLDGHPSVNLGSFWSNHQDKIKTKLFETLRDNSVYEPARQTILTYFDVDSYEELNAKQELDLDNKIKIFIEMLNEGKSEILKQKNEKSLDGHPSVKLTIFWKNHQEKIKTKLFETLRDNSVYEPARQTVLTYFDVDSYEELNAKQNNRKEQQNLSIDTKIDIFINMLNQGKSEVLRNRNKETLDGYPSVKLAQFWNKHQEKIKTILFETLRENFAYDPARQTVLTYFGVDGYEELNAKQELDLDAKIDIFIKMLNKGSEEIFKSRNNEHFEGYPNIKVGKFWHRAKNREIIITILFEKFKDISSYATARRLILENLQVKNIDEYYEKKESVSRQLKEAKKIKQELVESIKYLDEVDFTEQEQRKRA